MSAANDGGPAFPVPEVFDERRGEVTQYGSTGMTLRDYFAAKVMVAMIPVSDSTDTEWHDFDLLAFSAYAQADAMLKVRAL